MTRELESRAMSRRPSQGHHPRLRRDHHDRLATDRFRGRLYRVLAYGHNEQARTTEALALGEQALRIIREIGDRLLEGYGCGERGHAFLEGVQGLVSELGVGPQSSLGKATARVQRAVEDYDKGNALFRGEPAEDLPEALRFDQGDGPPNPADPAGSEDPSP